MVSNCESIAAKPARIARSAKRDMDMEDTSSQVKRTSSKLGPGLLPARGPGMNAEIMAIVPEARVHEGFRWKRALFESFIFLSIEQAYVVHDDFRWVVVENGVPFNHYWRDYKQSLTTWIHSGWDDGDPKMYSYLGHPIQGAFTGYIQIQNDPKSQELEFADNGYWWSRFKATLWSAVYGMQWNIGPLSELTVEKYGTKVRPWGVGQVDLVTTPTGGFVWMVVEDVLDKEVARRVEGATRNRFLIDMVRCSLNPIRSGANILHGQRPWHRASRDASDVYFSNQRKNTEFP
jgi:hypothetical protein